MKRNALRHGTQHGPVDEDSQFHSATLSGNRRRRRSTARSIKRWAKLLSRKPAVACSPNTSRCSWRSSASRCSRTAFSMSTSTTRSTRRRSSASSANRRKPPPPRSASSSRRSRASSVGRHNCRGRQAPSSSAASMPCGCCAKCRPLPSWRNSMPAAKSVCGSRGWPWTWSPAAPTFPMIRSLRKRWRARSITGRSISAVNRNHT